MTNRSFATTSVVALIALPIVLSAQQAAQADSSRRDTLRAVPLPPIVVTATLVPTLQSKLGVATSVLHRATLVAEPMPLAPRALAFLTGVAVAQSNGPNGPAVLHVRGGDEPFTQMMFDGVPVNISGGFNDVQGLMLTNVERVEIARGPLSARWGSSAMSGAVQFLTREGLPGRTRFELLAEGGRASERGDQLHSELNASGGTERLRYSGGVGYSYDRGIYRLAHNLRSGDASLRVDASLSETWSLTGTARYLNFHTNLPVRDQGVSRVPLDPNQRDGRNRWIGSTEATWATTPSWRNRFVAQVMRDEFDYVDAADGVTDSTAYPFVSGDSGFVADFNLTYNSAIVRPAVKYIGTNDLAFGRAGSRLLLSYGAEWSAEYEVDEQTGDFGDSRNEYQRDNLALFTELNTDLGSRVSLLAGTRLEQYEGLPVQLLPRASLIVALVPDRFALRAAAGRAFLVPNLTNQYLSNPFYEPNPDLDPMSSVTWELGASFSAPDRALTFSLGYFHQRNNDLIRTVPNADGTKVTNRNLGAAQSLGVEAELEGQWAQRWRGGLNVTFVETKILDNRGLDPTAYPNGGALPYVPRVTGSAFVSGDLSDAISAVARITLVGQQTVFTERFSGRRKTLDAYAPFDLVVQWHASDALDLYTRLTNVLDTRYEAAVDKPGTRRAAVVGVRTRF